MGNGGGEGLLNQFRQEIMRPKLDANSEGRISKTNERDTVDQNLQQLVIS